MKFFDDKNKNVNWWNRNYFFAGTIFISVLFIVIFAIWGNWGENLLSEMKNEEQNLNILVRYFYSLCLHYNFSNWRTLLFNILGLVVSGFYLERKTGSLNFILLVIGLGALCSTTDIFPDLYRSISSSFEWFVLSGYILIDYTFSLFQKNKNITNTIIGAVCIALLYIRLGFYDISGGGIGFSLYPHQILDVVSHFAIFMTGIIVSLIVQIAKFSYAKSK